MSLTSAAAQHLDQSSNASIMVQRRSSIPSSSSLMQPPQPTAFDSNISSSTGGGDVTSTSPPAFVSIRPLPSAAFAPPLMESHPPHMSSSSHSVSVSSVELPTAPSCADSTCSMEVEDQPSPKNENTGRWSTHEHQVFLEGLEQHGKAWKKIAVMIKTRSVVQVRTHAQKYFQKLSKGKKDGPVASTASTDSVKPAAIKRKSSKNAKSPSAATAKRRKVSVSSARRSSSSAVPLPTSQPTIALTGGIKVDHSVIDPQFMQTLNMTMPHELDGDIDESILDLLEVSDESSVDAVEQVIADDFEPTDEMEPTPVTPSVSYMSLDNASTTGQITQEQPVINDLVPRLDLVSSPKPEDFSIHNKLGTSGPELSPTTVTNMMEFKDMEQVKMATAAPAGIYVDALDWLMDVGVNMLPKSAAEGEEEWSPKLTPSTVAQVTSNALSVLDGAEDVF